MPVGFQVPRSFATGFFAMDVAIGDLNRDARTDIVVSNFDSNSVSVLLGNGDGSFQTQNAFATGRHPEPVSIADLNGDGRADLVVGNNLDGTVSVLLGNGDGSFQAQRTVTLPATPNAIALADFNGDGKLDLAEGGALGALPGNGVGVLLGNGDGSFQAGRLFPAGNVPASIAVADFNRDGKLDIAVLNGVAINGVNGLSMLLGNGDGTFRTQQLTLAGQGPAELAQADFNSDGKQDLLVTNSGGNSVSLLLGNGDGTFLPQQQIVVGQGNFHIAVADFDGDGKADFAVNFGGGGDNRIMVLLGNGDGSFQTGQTFVSNGHADLAAVDLNGDGRPDLITADAQNNTVSVLLNNAGALSTPTIPLLIQFDITTLTGSFPSPTPYTGPVTTLQQQYLYAGNDSLLLYVTQPNIWLRLGAGNDAITGPAGRNIIDAGGGSNFITGGPGQNTYYLDARLGQATWTTITDFRPGEDVTLWGYDVGSNNSASFVGIDGAASFQGATLRATVGSAPVALTFAGMGLETAAGLQLVGGTSAEGTPFLHIIF